MNYKILVVNLEKRHDRRNVVENLFNSLKFENYTFFNAIDGKSIPLTLEIKNLFNGNDFGSRKGVIGCALSHYNIWSNLIMDNDSDYYIVFEDDFTLTHNFLENFNKCKDFIEINKNVVDLLFLGYHSYENINSNISYSNIEFNDFNRNLYVGGTFGYIITKNGVRKMIEYINLNGIKHGIDYLLKINTNLNIKIVNPSIIQSEWVRNYEDNVDSDIQREYDSFDFNTIFDYNSYLFISKLDQINNDMSHIGDGNINSFLNVVSNIDESSGFNTLGYVKSKINYKELKTSEYFQNDNQGIFIKLDRKIHVKLLCNWQYSENLCNEWNAMSKGNYTWNNIKVTANDEYADYYIIVNKPLHDHDKYIPEKTIIFQMEPRCNNLNQNWGVKTWGMWADPDPNKFLQVRTHENFYNNCSWQLTKTFNELSRNNDNKIYNYLSTICSSKYFDPGHIKRIDFLKYMESRGHGIKIDIYGSDNTHNFSNYKGSLSNEDKINGIFPYKYYFMAENNSEYNYITEKIWEPLICECLCFYWGAPNLDTYINPLAFIRLDLDNFEESYNIIKNAIDNDLYSQRVDIIRQEKYKILNYYNFFPTVERIITMDMWKNNIRLLNSDFKIIICETNKCNKFMQTPLINTLKDFGFTICFSNNNKFNICNYLINDSNYNYYLVCDDNVNLNGSYNRLLYHMLYLPKNFDISLLSASKEDPFRIVSQYNSFYYNISKYIFNSSSAYFLSKSGAEKLINEKGNEDFGRAINNSYIKSNNLNLYAVRDYIF
jgi:GR25 family glycosyltransferase involved in LPS biosynthesis